MFRLYQLFAYDYVVYYVCKYPYYCRTYQKKNSVLSPMYHRGRLACDGKAVIKLYIKISDKNESYCCAPENYICGMKCFTFMLKN